VHLHVVFNSSIHLNTITYTTIHYMLRLIILLCQPESGVYVFIRRLVRKVITRSSCSYLSFISHSVGPGLR